MKHLSSQAADAVATQIGPSGSGRTVYSQVSTDSMGVAKAAASRRGHVARVGSRREAREERPPSGGRTRIRAEMRIGAAESSNSAAPIGLDRHRVGAPVTSRWLR